MASLDAALPRNRSFFGWRVVAAAFTVAVFGWGTGFYGPPVLLFTLHEVRGWPLSLVSSAVTLHFLLGALVVANMPACYRRWGLRAVTRAGGILSALGLLAWTTAETPWQLYAATVFSGAGWAATGAAAINAMVAPWFIRRRASALALAYNGASIGGVVFSPLWVGAIAALGLAGAAFVLGTVMAVTLWLLAGRYLACGPAQMGLSPDGDAAIELRPEVPAGAARPDWVGTALWRDRRFTTLAAGMSLGLFAQIGLIAHLFSLIVPALGKAGAGLAMGGATAAAIIGRTLLGWLLPPGADRRLAAAANLVIQMAGCLAFILAAGERAPLTLLGILLFGIGIGNATSLPPLIAQVEFDSAQVMRVVALITATSQASYAFAPAAFGWLREAAADPTGGGPPLFFILAGSIQLAAALLYLAGRRR